MEDEVDYDYDYVVNTDLIANPVIEKYKEQYDLMLGNDLLKNKTFSNLNLKDFIQYINASSPPTTSISQQQSYTLYVLAICMLDLVSIDDQTEEFYSTIYFPILYASLSNHLSTFKRLLAAQDSKIYSFIESKAADIVGFSLAVYNLSANIIKTDAQKIFLKTTFIETSPFNIQDLQAYYHNQLQYIYYEYIKNKTKGLVPIEDLIELQQSHRATSYSRLSIYEQGVRNHRIKIMCLKSDTLAEIGMNYDRLRGRILSNKFVSLFKQSTGMELKDSKTNLIYLNSLDLSALEKTYPLVCKLLRSIRVKSDIEMFTDSEKLQIRDTIFTTSLNKLKSTLGIKVATKLASYLATSVTEDLVSGEYIDPRTMSRVIVNSKVFTVQFQRFLLNVLDSLDI